jgi:hypothetical protein
VIAGQRHGALVALPHDGGDGAVDIWEAAGLVPLRMLSTELVECRHKSLGFTPSKVRLRILANTS